MFRHILASMAVLMMIVSTLPVQAGMQEDSKKIRAMLATQMPESKISRINKTPVDGLYEVIMPPQILYVSHDAKYVVTGNIINTATGENLTLPKRDRARIQAVEMLGEKSMIVFAPKNVKHTVTVFTDIDCSYCRKLHKEVAQYNKLGIKIRYAAYPRAGIGSASYKKAVSVWCADDRKAAMTRAKNNQQIDDKDCKNPVAKHYTLGGQIGVNGTPALVLENGQIIPGYVPAARLIKELERQKKVSKR